MVRAFPLRFPGFQVFRFSVPDSSHPNDKDQHVRINENISTENILS
jgi:hypothetical protein